MDKTDDMAWVNESDHFFSNSPYSALYGRNLRGAEIYLRTKHRFSIPSITSIIMSHIRVGDIKR